MQCLEVFFLVTDDDVIISDPESEYSPLVERFGGQVIKISPTSTQYINPMDINMNYSDDDNPIALKADFILSLCELIVGGSERRKDAISSEEIVKKYDEILLKGTNENTSNIKQVRFLFEGVYKTYNNKTGTFTIVFARLSKPFLIVSLQLSHLTSLSSG